MWYALFSLHLLLLLVLPCSGSQLMRTEAAFGSVHAAAAAQRDDTQDNDEHSFLPAVSLLQMAKEIYTTTSKQLKKERRDSMTKMSVENYGHPDWLHECKKIYLDVGTNIGVQIRKFYEPNLYVNSTILPLFTSKFGPPSKRCAPGSVSGMCVLGFEPNPQLQPRLQALEEAYTSLGWHVHIYPVAVSGVDGELPFEAPRWGGAQTGWGTDWGARVIDRSHDGFLQSLTDHIMARMCPVRAIDFSAFLKSLPATASIPLMKMDIEGAEWATLASMEDSGMLCKEVIDEAFIETHPGGDVTTWKDDTTMDAVKRRMKRQKKCTKGPMTMDVIDDESYFLDIDDCFKDKDFCKSSFGKSSSCSSH